MEVEDVLNYEPGSGDGNWEEGILRMTPASLAGCSRSESQVGSCPPSPNSAADRMYLTTGQPYAGRVWRRHC